MYKLLLTILLSSSLYSLDLVTMVKQHEGFSQYIYEDNEHRSIGYGTNLSHGITKAEAELLLVHRLTVIHEQLKQYDWFNKLSYNRRVVLTSMGYQLGLSGLLQFKDMIWCLKHNYFNAAANRMTRSLWYKQSGTRAKQLVQLMKQE